jgi:hypothetical protein
MAIPPNAKAHSQPMDPSDIKDWTIDVAGLLQAGEAVASWTLDRSVEAIAAGLLLPTTGGYSKTLAGNKITYWTQVDPAQQSNAAFDGAGISLPLLLTITTNSSPARVHQKTVVHQVANQ